MNFRFLAVAIAFLGLVAASRTADAQVSRANLGSVRGLNFNSLGAAAFVGDITDDSGTRSQLDRAYQRVDAIRRAQALSAYRFRRSERRRTALDLRRQRDFYRTPYTFNPGFALPPNLHDYSFLDTQRGYVVGENLRRHVNQTLGR